MRPWVLHAAAWSTIVLLALAWSALAWPAHALSGWIARNAGGIAGLPEWIERWTPSEWMAAWLPEAALIAIKAALEAGVPILEWLLALLPGLAGWLPPLVLAAWIAGLGLLLLAGIAGSVAVRLFWSGAAAPQPAPR